MAASLLYGVPPLDPPTYVGISALLLLVCCGAGLVPARRAARMDPVAVFSMEPEVTPCSPIVHELERFLPNYRHPFLIPL